MRRRISKAQLIDVHHFRRALDQPKDLDGLPRKWFHFADLCDAQGEIACQKSALGRTIPKLAGRSKGANDFCLQPAIDSESAQASPYRSFAIRKKPIENGPPAAEEKVSAHQPKVFSQPA